MYILFILLEPGGLEKGIATLVRNSSPGFKHVIVCLAEAGDSVRLLPENTRIISLGKKQGNSILFIARLVKILKELNPDIVHTRNWSGMDGIFAARLAGIKQIVHGEHGWDMADPYGKNAKRVFIRRFFSRWVKEYTCVSNQMAEWLKKDICVAKPVTQVYNGVDTDQYCPDNRKSYIRDEYGIPENVPIICTVARLDPIKDHPTLFQAFVKAQHQFPEIKLFVVGNGIERKKLESMAMDGIIFLGSRTDVPDIMRAVDIFVLPSLNEGISNTILEAMSSALPVVATKVGGQYGNC